MKKKKKKKKKKKRKNKINMKKFLWEFFQSNAL